MSGDAVPLSYMFAVTNLVNSSDKMNVSIFGQEWDSFISPTLIEGRYPENDQEVVVDQSFENYGIKLGDAIQLNGSETSFKIVGLTRENKFFTEPVVFTSLTTYWDLQGTTKGNRSISALVLQNDVEVTGNGLKQISIQKMISKIPGYTPQVNVFSGMILAMIVITGLIVGIFFLLSGLGIGLALLAIWAVILVLPATFFFYPSWLAYFMLSLVICLMALLGGVISLPRLLKVDPITAIAE